MTSSAPTETMPPRVRDLSWAPRAIAIVVLGQTLFFKFSAAPESVHIFETLGVEPWGRIASGLVELVAIALLVFRPALGGALAAGTMLGAIGAHLTLLGIDVQGDGGLLFGLAVLTLVAGLTTFWLKRDDLPFIGGTRE